MEEVREPSRGADAGEAGALVGAERGRGRDFLFHFWARERTKKIEREITRDKQKQQLPFFPISKNQTAPPTLASNQIKSSARAEEESKQIKNCVIETTQ